MRQIAIAALLFAFLFHTAVLAQEPADATAPEAAVAETGGAAQRIIGIDAVAVVPCIIQLPADYDAAKSYPLVIGLHGYGSSAARFATNWNAFDKPQFIYACPCGPYPVHGAQLNFSWYLFDTGMLDVELRARQNAMDLVLQVIGRLRADYSISSVYLLGFSQGGRLACDTGLTHPEAVQGIACLAAPYEAGTDAGMLNAARGLRVLLGVGADDDLRLGVEAMRDEFAANGNDVRYLDYPGGHSFSAEQLLEFQRWLFETPAAGVEKPQGKGPR